MADPAMREAFAFAIDKNEINTRLLGGTVQVANTNISPGAWFFADQPPATFDPAKAIEILEAAGWTDADGDGIREKDGLKAKIELCTTTRQVRQDTLALIADWLKAVGIAGHPERGRRRTDIFADYNDATRETAVRPREEQLRPRGARVLLVDRPARQLLQLPQQPVPPGWRERRSGQATPTIDAALDTVKTSVDFDVIKDAMADFQTVYVEQTLEIPLYYRKNVELVGPTLGNFFANPTQAGPTWNAVDWFKQ